MPSNNNSQASRPVKSLKTSTKGKGTAIVDKLEELSPTNPIPFEGGRGFSVMANSSYLPFLSNDDNYASLLLQARLLSVTHNACVITKKDYCAGGGFQLSTDEEIKDKIFKEWCKATNVKNEDVIEINKQIYEYFFTFGNVPIEIVRFTIGNKKRFYIYVQNFLEWRLSAPDPVTGMCTYAIQSKLFLRENYIFNVEDMTNARKLPIYNPRNSDRAVGLNKEGNIREGYNWYRDENGVERTLIWYKNSTAGFPNYGLPSAVSALIYELLEYKGARYNLDNFENNMVVSAILALKGALTQPELNKIGKRILTTHTGDGKRGRVMVVGSEQGIEGSDLHTMETQKDGSYEKSDAAWSQKIILANQWDAVLAGLLGISTMGKGVGFLTKIIEEKKKTVIEPAQKDLVSKVWQTILQIGSKWMGWNVDIENIMIKNSIDISGLTDVDITPAVTVDEVRQAKGLPKADKKIGKKYLGELGADQKRGVYTKDNGKSQEPDVSQK